MNKDTFHDIRYGDFTPTLEEREWIRYLYEGEVRYVDDNVGKLMGTLKRLGIYEQTLVILTSDHGEEFWEHGGFEHGHTLYQELLHVPMIIKLPNVNSGKKISQTVSVRSITPTILELCGLDYDRDYFDVGSLEPLFSPDTGSFSNTMIVSSGQLYYEKQTSLIIGKYKYIFSLVTGREELYDLSNDPGEQRSLHLQLPEVVKQAREQLLEHTAWSKKVREHYGIRQTEKINLDNQLTEQLQSLGYIQ